jgi:dihydrolipoamide dehydrogenase
MNYDVVVIGGGPGGEAAAWRAHRRGASTCLIEANRLGGACLNVGCIPTKAMLHASELFWQIQRAGQLGISSGPVKVDGPAFMRRVSQVVSTLRGALDKKYQAGGVDLLRGWGRLTGPHTVGVDLCAGGQEQIEARSVIIATGSVPARPAVFPWHSAKLLTTDEALTAETLPKSVLIVGGGVIGCELATIYAELGIPTTLVEMLDRLAATLDGEASKLINRTLVKRGVNVQLRSKITELNCDDAGVLAITDGGQKLQAACALVAVGRRANIHDMGLSAAGVKVRDGLIAVDDRCRTNVPGIYAVGDAADRRQYAHLATRMGVVAGKNATGGDAQDDLSAVPIGVFTHPEVTSVGLSEKQAVERHLHVRSSAVQYRATGVGWAYDQREGLVKIVADAGTGRIYGGVAIGYRAAEVLQELTVAVKHALTVSQLAETIHIHPTFSEAICLAAEQWLAEVAAGGP